ncbi:putative transcription factor KAN4 [Acorus calamus]|uniref:Transcription factor KAN4 n=1 Tax=Acorus calamus TaxID=4465 RepID=A0AAV9CQ24_ACOCL|nr:putative transcription factor KAN4 [Acorus calamus]
MEASSDLPDLSLHISPPFHSGDFNPTVTTDSGSSCSWDDSTCNHPKLSLGPDTTARGPPGYVVREVKRVVVGPTAGEPKRIVRSPRMRWTTSLHAHFVRAVKLLGGHESQVHKGMGSSGRTMKATAAEDMEMGVVEGISPCEFSEDVFSTSHSPNPPTPPPPPKSSRGGRSLSSMEENTQNLIIPKSSRTLSYNNHINKESKATEDHEEALYASRDENASICTEEVIRSLHI